MRLGYALLPGRLAYGRDGEPCRRCGTPIRRVSAADHSYAGGLSKGLIKVQVASLGEILTFLVARAAPWARQIPAIWASAREIGRP